ncbi:MAG: nitroreductase family protein [Oscillospiraceae bacterium]|nr:nitroreductase family protein [Oscillospiraceae bacterium]
MNYLELLKNRSSCRKYTNEPVSCEDLEKIIMAANAAPIGSSRTEDIHLTVVEDRAVLDKMAEAMERRREDKAAMANITEKIKDDNAKLKAKFDPFYGAPAVIFISHRKQDIQPGIEYCNVTTVALAMHLAATEMGLGSVFMWGSLEAMRMYPEYDNTAVLELPEGFEPLLGVAVGHRAAEPKDKELTADKLKVNYF